MNINLEGINKNEETREVSETKKSELLGKVDGMDRKLDESSFEHLEKAKDAGLETPEEDKLKLDPADMDWKDDELTIDDLENIDSSVEERPWLEIVPNFVYKAKVNIERMQSARLSRQEARLDDGSYKNTPLGDFKGGYWTGTRGNSIYKTNPNYIPQNSKMNPEKISYGKMGISEVKYVKGEPDFEPFAEDTEKINMTDNRPENFQQADELLAKKRGCTVQEIKEYRESNHLTWHERQDMKRIDLVPSVVNGSFVHSGGVSFVKRDIERESTKL